MQKRQERLADQMAAKTHEYFGASCVDALRAQLKRSRASAVGDRSVASSSGEPSSSSMCVLPASTGSDVVDLINDTAASSGSGAGFSGATTGAAQCVYCSRVGVLVPRDSPECCATQREVGCHACDKKDCWTLNDGSSGYTRCKYFNQQRPDVVDAPVTGEAAPNMIDRSEVTFNYDDPHRVLVRFRDVRLVRGLASGKDNNCLIVALRESLKDIGYPSWAHPPDVRDQLRIMYPSGPNRVTEMNFLDLRPHCESVIDLIGRESRRKGLDENNFIHARNFTVCCVFEQLRRVGEEVGVGRPIGRPNTLYVLNQGLQHFVPLLEDRS